MDKIYIVSINVTTRDSCFTEYSFSFKETGSLYVIDKQSNFGGKTTRLDRKNLLHIDSMIRDGEYSRVHFYTWCFSQDIEKAKMMLAGKAFEKIQEIKRTSEELYANILNIKK